MRPERHKTTLGVEDLRRALAELEDAKIRLRRENERELELLRARTLERLIPVLDNLDRSIAAASTHSDVGALLAGLRLVQSQFIGALAELGLTRVSTVGHRFDPRLHDAIAVVPVSDPRKDGVVVEELEPAYLYGDRVVRPAKVQVGRAADRPAA